MGAWVWAYKDVVEQLHDGLSAEDTVALRSTSRDWRGVLDSTLSSLAPSVLHSSEACARFPGLKTLDLSRLQLPPDSQLPHLTALTALTRLTLGGSGPSRLREPWLEAIGQLTGLRSLTLRGDAKVRWAALRHLTRLTGLRNLGLIGLGASAADGIELGKLLAAAGQLTRLVLGDSLGLSFMSDGALEGLGALRQGQLAVLNLSGCIELTDAGLAHLSRQTALTELDLHNCMKLGPTAMKLVGSLSQLERLNLRGCAHLADEQLLLLGGLRAVTWLSLQSCNSLSGATLAPLISKMPRLAHLNMAHCVQLSDASLAALAALPNAALSLQHLDVSGCLALTPDGLACLSKLRALTHLGAAGLRCKREVAAAAWSADSSGNDSLTDGSESREAGVPVDGSCSSADNSSRADNSSSVPGSSNMAASSPAPAAASWEALTALRTLDLSGLRLVPLGAAAGMLGRLPRQLQHLQLAGSYLCQPTASITAIGGRLAQLQSLNLFGVNAAEPLCEQHLLPLSALTALTSLSVSGICCSDGSSVADGSDCGSPLQDTRHGAGGNHAAAGVDVEVAAVAAAVAAGVDAGVNVRAPVRRALVFEQAGPSYERRTSLQEDLPLHDVAAHALAATEAGAGSNNIDSSSGGSNSSGSSSGGSSSGGGSSSSAALPIEVISHELRRLTGLGGARSSSACLTTQTAAAHNATVPNASNSCHVSTTPAAVQGQQAPACATAGGARAAVAAPKQQQLLLSCLLASPAWLPQLTALQQLSLRESPAVTDAWLPPLANAASLHSLDLSGCRGLTGVGLAALAHLEALTSLRLQACSGIGDEGMVVGVAALGGLRRLGLACCGGFGDEGLAAVGRCSRLAELSVAGNRSIGSRGLAGLRGLAHLQKLDAAMCCSIEDCALGALARLPRLRELDLRCCWKLTDAGVCALLARSTALLSINVEGCHRLSAACQPQGSSAAGGSGAGLSGGGSPAVEGLRRRPGVITRAPGTVVVAA